MASFNRVIVVGNLCSDIELKYLQSGTAVGNVGLAVNERRKTQSGEWVEEPSFFDVTFWGRTAEIVSEYLGKGSPILIEGRLKQERWEKDGQKRSKVKIICERMQMLGGKKEKQGDSEYSESMSSEQQPAASTGDDYNDVPF